jgi:hypothetical protein
LPGQRWCSIARSASSVSHRAAAVLLRKSREERMRQQHRITDPLAQRRYRHDYLGQPVKQVLAKALLADELLQVLMRGAHHAHVDRNLPAAADALDGAFLQKAQQLGLQRLRQVADFIEHQRAAVRRFDLAGRGLGGTGEGAPRS